MDHTSNGLASHFFDTVQGSRLEKALQKKNKKLSLLDENLIVKRRASSPDFGLKHAKCGPEPRSSKILKLEFTAVEPQGMPAKHHLGSATV